MVTPARLCASPETTFIGVLSDANERDDPCVPALYSKSLLYLVSRALESRARRRVVARLDIPRTYFALGSLLKE